MSAKFETPPMKAVNVHSITNNTVHLTRKEILDWLVVSLGFSITRLEDLANGSIYCQIMEKLFPGSICVNRINFSAKSAYESFGNYKLLLNAFRECEVSKDIPIESLISGAFSENFRFAQWFRLFYEANIKTHQRKDNFNSKKLNSNKKYNKRHQPPPPQQQRQSNTIKNCLSPSISSSLSTTTTTSGLTPASGTPLHRREHNSRSLKSSSYSSCSSRSNGSSNSARPQSSLRMKTDRSTTCHVRAQSSTGFYEKANGMWKSEDTRQEYGEVTDPSTDETIVSHCNNTIHKNASTSPSLQPKNSLNIQNSDIIRRILLEQIMVLMSITMQHILSDQYTVSSSYAYSNKTDEDINDCVTSQQVSSISSCKHNQFDNLEHSTTTDSIHQYHRIQTASPAIDVNDNYALNIENNITKSLKQNLHRTDEIQQSFNEILAKNHNRQTMITPTTSTSPESSMTNQSLLEKSIIDKLKRRIISLNKENSQLKEILNCIQKETEFYLKKMCQIEDFCLQLIHHDNSNYDNEEGGFHQGDNQVSVVHNHNDENRHDVDVDGMNHHSSMDNLSHTLIQEILAILYDGSYQENVDMTEERG
uniref:Calponin-homology (CH) domain-containing protein n=1 Tax=Trichobilharzia regenti TaxID=157069 RepID=A0AA85IS83_TRIRE|nr:unnamed protein product [Trichobilharzia regenti]